MKKLGAGDVEKILIQKKITNLFEAARNLEKLGTAQILEKPEISETWIVTPDGVLLRKICGHRSIKGICFLPSGYATNHIGKGNCKKHSRSLLYNPQLNALEGIPSRFGELLAFVDTVEEDILLNVDHEIKFLYALQQNLLLTIQDPLIPPALVVELRELTMDIVKTKAIKNKIQKEVRLDSSTVRDFVKNIMDIIVKRVPGAEAQNIMQDIFNNVIVPYKNSDKISNSRFDFKEEIEKTLRRKDE
jgi:hypothetical protein